MMPLTLEWVEKAEEDFISAHREYRARGLNPIQSINTSSFFI